MQPPDAILASSGFVAPVVGSIQDDPDAPDGDWLGGSLPFNLRVSFSTPGGALAGIQTFKVLARKRVGAPSWNMTVSLYEAGVLVRSLGTTLITSTTGQVVNITFDASEVTNAANVEVLISGLDFIAIDFTDNAGLYQTTDTSTPVTTAGQAVQYIVKGGITATLVTGAATWQATGIVVTDGTRFDIASPFNIESAVIACTPALDNESVIGGDANYLAVAMGVYRWRDNVDMATSAMISRTGMQIAAFDLDTGTGLVRAWMDGAEGETEDLKSPLLIQRLFSRSTATFYEGTVAYMAMAGPPFSQDERRLHIKAAAEATWTVPGGTIILMGDEVPFNALMQGTDTPANPVLIVHHGVSGKTLDEATYGTYGSSRHDASNFATAYAVQAFSPTFDETRFSTTTNYEEGGYPDGRRTADIENDFIASVLTHLGQPAKSVLLYGFGAGAGYLSRVAAYIPPSQSIERYVVTAPSTWVVPIRVPAGTFTTAAAPYGFNNLGMTAGEEDDAIRAYLQLPLTVYCGSLDNDPSSGTLTDPTNLLGQGAHRLARAQNVFAMAQQQATALGVTLGWQLVIAVGVGNSGTNMLNAPEREQAFFPTQMALTSAAAVARSLGGIPVATLTGFQSALTSAAAVARSLGQTPVATKTLHQFAPAAAAAPSRSIGYVPVASRTTAGGQTVLPQSAALSRTLGYVPLAGSFVTITGNQGTTQYKPSAGTLTKDVLAVGATFHIMQATGSVYPFVFDNQDNRIAIGGTVVGDDISLTSDWLIEYDQGNSAALRVVNSTNFTARDWHLNTVWDAFRPAENCDGWLLKDIWAENVRDDFVENDKCNIGAIRNCLVDGAMCGCISTTDHPQGTATKANVTIEIEDSLFRSKLYLVEGVPNMHGGHFKCSKDGINYNPTFNIIRCTFAVENPNHNGGGAVGERSWYGFQNMVISGGPSYWINMSDTPFSTTYLNMIPSGFTVLQGAPARAHWAAKKAAWLTAHGR